MAGTDSDPKHVFADDDGEVRQECSICGGGPGFSSGRHHRGSPE